MTSTNKSVGKYFLVRYKCNPNLVLEVKDGSTVAGTPVVIGELQLQIGDSNDHQLWYFDRILQTLCNKLTGFGLHCDANQSIIVRRCSKMDDQHLRQHWQIDNMRIKLKSQPELTVGVSSDASTCTGAPCRASTASGNDCWMIDSQPPFYLYISSGSNRELVVDVSKADRKPGAKVIVYANKGDLADNQLWYEDENSILRSKLNSFALDAAVGKEVVLTPYDPRNTNQQWVIDGDMIRNVVLPTTCLSFKDKCFLSSACLYAENASNGSVDAPRRRWLFNYIPHQSASLSHSGCGKFFNVCSHVGGFTLHVEGELIEPGSVVTTQIRERNTLRQQFYQDDITGTIRSALRSYCLDIDSSGLAVINPFDPHKKTQQWAVVGKQIQSRHNVKNVLQMATELTSGPGSRLTVGEYFGKEHQHWDFLHTPARCFFVVSQMNGKVLDVKGDNTSSGAALIIYDRKSPPSLNQLFYEDETGLLRSKLNGYVIDTRNGEAAVRPYDPSIKQQQWMIVGDRIQNKYDSDQVLDIYGNSSLSSKVGQYSFHGGENQRWKFDMVQ